MPFEPIRFLHAANLRLDSQITDVGPCPDELRGLLETATLIAFERMIDAAILQRVDFVLLTGNCFDRRDHSLPARIALLDGFRRLERHDIRVFVLPGKLDPPAAWREFSETPDNVTTFCDSSTDAVAVLRQGKVIASVACVEERAAGNDTAFGQTAEQTGPARLASFRVGLCPGWRQEPQTQSPASAGPFPLSPRGDLLSFDYVAVGGSESRHTWRDGTGIAHGPGSTQALRRRDAGPHGCTLVEVDTDGGVNCRLLATAPIRFENLAVGIEPQSSRQDLLDRMRTRLDELSPQTAELLWLVHWTLSGSGALYEELGDASRARQFIEQAESQLAHESRPPLLHSLDVLPDRAALAQCRHEQEWTTTYFDALEAGVPLTPATLQECLSEAAAGTDFNTRMRQLADVVDERVVLGQARQFGIDRFRRAAHPNA